MQEKNLLSLDLEHIFHPCTQMKDHEKIPLIPISHGKGVWLYDFEGRGYIDGISSWWVNLFGHANEYISNALIKQARTLEHVLLAGFTHKPIIELSSRLCALLDNRLQKCFYADNGSSAIEVALKMSFHKARLKKQKRHKFLSLKNSYHGETLGALAVGNVELYKDIYGPILLESLSTGVPALNSDGDKELLELEALLKKQGDEICAFILEPLVQCAGNMHMYSASFIKEACAMARDYGIDIIFDEIAVGFGRTGSMFAYEQCGVVPDFLCLSKGISGGYLPLSVVVMSDETYQEFYAPYEEGRSFLHSHSYTGNPLACACACAVLDIFEKDDVIASNKKKSAKIIKKLEALKGFKNIKNIRYRGMIFAFDLISTKPRAGLVFFQEALKYNLILRPLGNTIYFMPPYVISDEEIDFVFEGIGRILEDF